MTRDRSVTKVTEGITRGMGKLTFDSEYQNQMASREKAQNVRAYGGDVCLKVVTLFAARARVHAGHDQHGQRHIRRSYGTRDAAGERG